MLSLIHQCWHYLYRYLAKPHLQALFITLTTLASPLYSMAPKVETKVTESGRVLTIKIVANNSPDENVANQKKPAPPLSTRYEMPDIESQIINLLAQEKEGISGYLNSFTYFPYAREWVLNAKKNKSLGGNLIVHNAYFNDFCVALRFLLVNDIAVAAYTPHGPGKPAQSPGQSFIVFEKNGANDNKPLVITGSYEWNGINHLFKDSLKVFTDEDTIKKFKKMRDDLAKKSTPLKPEHAISYVKRQPSDAELNSIPDLYFKKIVVNDITMLEERR